MVSKGESCSVVLLHAQLQKNELQGVSWISFFIATKKAVVFTPGEVGIPV